MATVPAVPQMKRGVGGAGVLRIALVVCAVAGLGLVWWVSSELWGDDAPGGRRDTIWINALGGDPAPIFMPLSEEEENLVLRANLSGSCQPEYVRTVLEELDVTLSTTEPVRVDTLPLNAKVGEPTVRVDPDQVVTPIELAIMNPSCTAEVLISLAQADSRSCIALEQASTSSEKAEVAFVRAKDASVC